MATKKHISEFGFKLYFVQNANVGFTVECLVLSNIKRIS